MLKHFVITLLAIGFAVPLAAAHDPTVIPLDTDADGESDLYIVEWHDDTGVWQESNSCAGVQGPGNDPADNYASCGGPDTHVIEGPHLH